ncbi:Uncharacterized membrane protein YpjA [Halogranum gelatinilyticum]|uniref:Uncharacterized membrane protein YpjA n=1 Tax=Halogranum gelatinilyticum TaxID=660521 RepID=A0A1G9TIM7_9EURY|nr:DUF1405 domain-containing protein [Halogranum gelatinilyticum]SDM47639.1 Uncharacterized membrane protein YpjA [Halogranum gelatinilyticum]
MDLSRLLSDRAIEEYLGSGPTLVWLLVVNATAFLVGIRFYVETMPSVPTFLWPLYGDSPMALALATLSLATLLPALGSRVLDTPMNRPLAYLHTLSFVWLVKYGVWTAIALNLRPELYFGFDARALYDYWFIIGTHLLFVLEAVAIARIGRTTRGALGFALVLLLANDIFDYWFGFHPPLRYTPDLVLPAVTVVLSFGTVLLAGRVFAPLSARTE